MCGVVVSIVVVSIVVLLSAMGFRHYFWTSGEPWRTVRSWLVPRLMRAVHGVLMCTLRISASGIDTAWEHVRRGQAGNGNGVVFITWHDLTFMPLHLFRHKNIGVMMSHSRAGQIQAAFFRLHGWPTVWGSTKKREGIRALREVLRLLREGQSFAFTPDGPKGPRHHAQPGAIYLASQAPAVLMPLGVAATSSWHLPTWDKYLIPKPFARVHIHIGTPFSLPQDAAKDDVEMWQKHIGDSINQASQKAEDALKSKRAAT